MEHPQSELLHSMENENVPDIRLSSPKVKELVDGIRKSLTLTEKMLGKNEGLVRLNADSLVFIKELDKIMQPGDEISLTLNDLPAVIRKNSNGDIEVTSK